MTQAAILAASGSPGTTTGFKNRIINGAMVIDQRNAGASSTTVAYTVDRWSYYAGGVNGKFTWGQNLNSVTPPTGFTNYLGFQSTSAYTPNPADRFGVYQAIEGFNTADLAWGTANAKTVTLSFQVYSSLTGTFAGFLQNSSTGRNYGFTYTISSANTWTPISVTIPGDTTGTWLTNNGVGVQVNFSIGVGSSQLIPLGWSATAGFGVSGQVQVVSTSGATWYVTAVQLEVGTTATNFDFRSYGTELSLCQRYYNKFYFGNTGAATVAGINSFNYTTGLALGYFTYPVAMRSVPSLVTTGSASNYQVLQTGGSVNCSIVPTAGNATTSSAQINFSTSSGLNAGQGSAIRGQNSTDADWIAFNSEL